MNKFIATMETVGGELTNGQFWDGETILDTFEAENEEQVKHLCHQLFLEWEWEVYPEIKVYLLK